ncbi:hypothetical protein Tco_1196724, partial [Tanacetum coccineum]
GRAQSLTLLVFARRLGLYHAEELDEEGLDRGLDTTTLRELNTTLEGKTDFLRHPQPRMIPRVAIIHPNIPQRAQKSNNVDLYERMGSMEIRQGRNRRGFHIG